MKDEAIDISGMLPADETIKEVMKPGGIDGTGWKVTLAGPAHPKALKWINEKSQRDIRKAQLIEQAQVNGRKFKSEDRDVDDARRENVGWVVSRIVDWTPIKIGSETFAFSDAAAIDLLSRPQMGWAFNQFVEWLGDERSFTPASAKP